MCTDVSTCRPRLPGALRRRAHKPGACADTPTFREPEKRNCLALLAFTSLLWCTEALPLYVTSMLVPLLVVVLRVLVDGSQHPPQRLSCKQAAPHIFHAMNSQVRLRSSCPALGHPAVLEWPAELMLAASGLQHAGAGGFSLLGACINGHVLIQVIMLLLGGFTIAAALSKHAIAKILASWVLSKVGQRPGAVLMANMLVATFASMWISNVAAPVLCFSLVQPVLRTLDATHSFAKSLVMGEPPLPHASRSAGHHIA